MEPAKSNGHIAFSGPWEYFRRGRNIYRAQNTTPLMDDGYRFGRFETTMAAWPLLSRMLGLDTEQTANG